MKSKHISLTDRNIKLKEIKVTYSYHSVKLRCVDVTQSFLWGEIKGSNNVI